MIVIGDPPSNPIYPKADSKMKTVIISTSEIMLMMKITLREDFSIESVACIYTNQRYIMNKI